VCSRSSQFFFLNGERAGLKVEPKRGGGFFGFVRTVSCVRGHLRGSEREGPSLQLPRPFVCVLRAALLACV
jgi:hypothetical protein